MLLGWEMSLNINIARHKDVCRLFLLFKFEATVLLNYSLRPGQIFTFGLGTETKDSGCNIIKINEVVGVIVILLLK